MADPFKPQSSQQLIREAKLGLSVVALLFATLIYVGTLRITGQTPLFPVSEMVEFQSTKTVRHSPIETLTGSETINPSKTFLPGKGIFPSSDEVIGKNIEPPRVSQFFPPRAPRAASTRPNFQIKSPPPPKPSTPNDVPPANRKSNGGIFVPLKTKINAINPDVSQIKPKPLGSTKKAGKVFHAQFESNLSQFENPREPTPITPIPSRNSSCLYPSKQSIQRLATNHYPPTEAHNQSKLILAPVQFANVLPRLSNDVTSKPKTSKPSTQSVNGLNTPSNFIPPDLKLLNQLPRGEAQKSSQTYKTKPGDTYWSVSVETYEDGRYFRALFRHNQSIHADYNLTAGLKLKIPAKSELEKLWPNECPTTTEANTSVDNAISVEPIAYHVTSKGETLFEIARQKLNQGSRFIELYQLNLNSLGEDAHPDSPLPNGLKLILPK